MKWSDIRYLMPLGSFAHPEQLYAHCLGAALGWRALCGYRWQRTRPRKEGMLTRRFLIVASLLGVVQGFADEQAKLEIYSDVHYTATTPKDCTSWMLSTTPDDARQFYAKRKDCPG